ncbi:zinc finger BED domain-containing protein RICESLEEPER 2-like [Typha angustifolia]|uniref:zinc finger BED domain-containing protein RICESLEEPER 2-like n=1 Tax=Typha angustifolia TaxID=59011 RepID=UPI003C2BEE6A
MESANVVIDESTADIIDATPIFVSVGTHDEDIGKEFELEIEKQDEDRVKMNQADYTVVEPSARMSESVTKNLSNAVSENEPIEIDIGEEDNETNKEEESNSQKKGRRKTSDVWLYVKRVKVKENGEEVLNPHYERISRNTMRSDVMKVYESAKEEVKLLLKGTYRISLTSDLWTSNQNIGYMSLTAHFVDSDWTLQKRIINFCQLEPPHTGVAISDAIIDCLIAWGIEDKVSTITLDNASANDVAAKTIMNNFQVRDKLYFKGLIFHVRCCAHILNLVVQDGIHVIQDVIENIRCSVTYLKKSPSRMYKFGEIARQLSVPTSKGLALDVATRWNSTYVMLEHAFVYQKVFEQYATRDENYKWLPSEDDWFKAAKVCEYLKKIYDVTQIISGSSYPTANLFLIDLLKVKEALNKGCESEFYFLKDMAIEMRKKFDKYWEECDMLLAVAAVLDPRYKMKFINFCFPKIYCFAKAQINMQRIHRVLYTTFESYKLENASGENNRMNDISQLDKSDDLIGAKGSEGQAEFKNFLESTNAVEPLKSELEIYLEEQTTTFSAGGRVLNDFRSSLSSETVEALVPAMDNVFVRIPNF